MQGAAAPPFKVMVFMIMYRLGCARRWRLHLHGLLKPAVIQPPTSKDVTSLPPRHKTAVELMTMF